MKRAALTFALVFAACGPGPTVCTATFSGNFTDSSTGACPVLEAVDGGTVFRFHAGAPSVNSALNGMILLDATPVSSRSQTATGDWSALLTREPGCVYTAGRDATPSGTYALTLTGTAPPHGTLVLQQYVHALPMADCGRGDVETVQIEF